MPLRAVPIASEVTFGSFLWGAQIPWLPDLLADEGRGSVSGRPLLEAYGRQVAMLRAVATTSPIGSALQLRFAFDPDRHSPLSLVLLGRAHSEQDAKRLARLVVAVLPQELPLESLEPSEVAQHLDWLPDVGPEGWSEVRRAVETLQPHVDLSASGDDPTEPVVLPWNWSAQAMLSTLGLLREQSARVVLGVHIERRVVPVDVLDYMIAACANFRRLAGGDEHPLVAAGLGAYRRWLRELPRAALHMRVFLGAEEPVAAGMAEAIGVDLTRAWESAGAGALAGGFSVVRPDSVHEVDLASELLTGLVSHPWQAPDDPDLAELQCLFDPHEASTAFRLPVTAEGGIPGVATGRLSSLPKGARRKAEVTDGIELGPDANGMPFNLTLSALNRHTLVAGLPGFGKTTTVQSMLVQLAALGIPFLVIDPAKSDYSGVPVPGLEVLTLDPDCVAFNPFAPPVGVAQRAYVARALAAFDTAFQFSLWPIGLIVLGRALTEAFASTPEGEAPTLNTLVASVGELIRRSRYTGEVRANLEASLLARLENLGEGVLGDTLRGGPHDGIDWAGILAKPTIIELRRFSAPAERSLVFALLLAGLISYREANPRPGLAHVTVLEEAHRVLGGGQVDAVGSGVRAFSDALAELRGSGEGFVIVDQAPSGLHSSVLKLTSNTIVHRTVDRSEREILGASMLLREDQLDDLARLPPGRAIVFAADSEAPSLVQISPRSDTSLSRRAVEGRRHLTSSPPSRVLLVCAACPVACRGSAGLSSLDSIDQNAPPAELAKQAWAARKGNSAEATCLVWTVIGQRDVCEGPRSVAVTRDVARRWILRWEQTKTTETT